MTATMNPRVAKFDKDLRIIMLAFAREFPFWGVLSERCRFSVTEKSGVCDTACITPDGHIIFNLDFYEKLTQRQLLFLVAHELCHFIFEHSGRKGTRDHYLWNVATDYAINLMLKYQFERQEFLLSEMLLDEKYEGWNAERIYDDVVKNPPKRPKVWVADLLDGEGGEGEGEDGPSDGDIVVVRDRRVEPPKRGRGQSSEEHRQQVRDWIRNAVCEAHATAKSQGSMPAGMERVIMGHLKPKVNWLQALRQRLRFGASRKASRDITWTVPNRRFLGSSYIFPSSIGPDSPKIAFAIDTSGSMSEDDLKQAIAELEDIRKQFNAKVYFLDCDAGVYESRWISPYEPLPALQGGGGTDFAPVFEHLIEKRIQPDCCVMFTDGYGSFGDDPTQKFDVLWVITNQDVQPPFGDVIRVNVQNDSE
jgi:predicted metal-dependent peptidase